ELELIAEVIASPDATGLVLAGEPGVGKTRLAQEALALCRVHGFGVEEVVATQAAATIPFGAVAHLLPDPGRLVSDRLDLLRQAAHAIADRASTGRLVLCVDDAHLLDDASAAFVHQLVVTRSATVI